MTTTDYITFILLGVIGLVFLIDFILNSSKKPLEKSVEKFVEKESAVNSSSNPLSWILRRKKNISLSLILIPILKALTHFFLFPKLHEVVVDRFVIKSTSIRVHEEIKEVKEFLPLDLGSHFELMFTERLDLFIPVTIIFLVLVWFFNDKIKAR